MLEKATPETIDFSKSKQYTLSIRLSADGFSFSIYNPISENAIYVFHRQVDAALSLTANLKPAFQELEFLNYSYKRVNVMMVSKRFTLLPLELFDDECIDSLFYYNHSKNENEKVLYNIIKKCNAVVLFSLDKSAYSFITERHPEARFYSQVSPLAEHFSVKSRLGNTRKMYAYLRESAVDVYGFERGHIQIINSFSCKNTEDTVYYLLHTWKQLAMDQERDELHLTGKFTDKALLLAELQRFIAQVFVINPSAELTKSVNSNIDQVPFDIQILLSND